MGEARLGAWCALGLAFDLGGLGLLGWSALALDGNLGAEIAGLALSGQLGGTSVSCLTAELCFRGILRAVFATYGAMAL